MMSAAYEQSLLALTPALEECRTPGEIAEVSRRFVRPMGLDHVACVNLPPGGEEAGVGQTAIEVHFSTFPGEWLSRCATGELLDHDPILAEARTSGKSFTWREAWSRWHGPSAVARAALARGLGLVDGIAIPMVRSSFAVPVVLAAGRCPGFDNTTKSALSLASSAIYRRVAALEVPRFRSGSRLTERERQCLSWAAAGKSDWEIGQIIELSAKTVNYHIENAKRKSGVQTRVQAIVEALRSGVIA